ncbi:hypothetical protein [Bdellovibrio bacteriovorus]|uniref:hypothetical protein n=1 Tax=Bdellovibrio bacteriovorus TaxID=959 RepID=UPI0035A6B271
MVDLLISNMASRVAKIGAVATKDELRTILPSDFNTLSTPPHMNLEAPKQP